MVVLGLEYRLCWWRRVFAIWDDRRGALRSRASFVVANPRLTAVNGRHRDSRTLNARAMLKAAQSACLGWKVDSCQHCSASFHALRRSNNRSENQPVQQAAYKGISADSKMAAQETRVLHRLATERFNRIFGPETRAKTPVADDLRRSIAIPRQSFRNESPANDLSLGLSTRDYKTGCSRCGSAP